MASNYTTNYQLNQWEAGDQVLRTEFNRDNQKIDAALAGLAGQNEELEAALAATAAGAGNCQMELFTYTGTGTCGAGNPTRVQFSHLPEVFFIGGGESLMLGRGGVSRVTLIAQNLSARPLLRRRSTAGLEISCPWSTQRTAATR